MKLSICVITMNRAIQLKEALASCLTCELPKETEFVVIDNASTDNTEEAVRETLGECGYLHYYEKLTENLGVGRGRNYAYSKARGEYVYMLDDDAVIDFENNPHFFEYAIKMMDMHSDVVTLTTQIYDMAWKKNRVENNGPRFSDGLYKCKMFCGGSHFLKKTFYTSSPYLPNMYGYEELPPSLMACDAGKINAFCPEIRIIHKPAVNKWDYSDEKNHSLLIKDIALPYAIKKMMYPVLFHPVLVLAHKKRIHKYLLNVIGGKERARETITAFCRDYPIDKKIKVRTVIKLFKDFKLSVF